MPRAVASRTQGRRRPGSARPQPAAPPASNRRVVLVARIRLKICRPLALGQLRGAASHCRASGRGARPGSAPSPPRSALSDAATAATQPHLVAGRASSHSLLQPPEARRQAAGAFPFVPSPPAPPAFPVSLQAARRRPRPGGCAPPVRGPCRVPAGA
ncbi:uncharacterized protein A4U43_C03F14450 [Asparagus officinalis]|uniref:Uncharacterized protein n=1 Tax=Asparagus officinalis TaxID=4686 RepID=A0A5P1FA14_ASPOF|nr:uncharacterized protein A4U43_C03F14450 [Asparagus officinalis]